MEASYARLGGRHHAYAGTLTDNGEVVWSCPDEHPAVEPAIACAEQRALACLPLAGSMERLVADLPPEFRARLRHAAQAAGLRT
jgi:hypothetical protein